MQDDDSDIVFVRCWVSLFSILFLVNLQTFSLSCSLAIVEQQTKSFRTNSQTNNIRTQIYLFDFRIHSEHFTSDIIMHMLLDSLIVEDKMQKDGDEFQYLTSSISIDSLVDFDSKNNPNPERDELHLIQINYRNCNKVILFVFLPYSSWVLVVITVIITGSKQQQQQLQTYEHTNDLTGTNIQNKRQ